MIDQYRLIAGVPEVLRPYSNWASYDLAQQLHELVKDNQDELKSRNLLEIVSNYSDGDITKIVDQVQTEQQHLGHFAVVNVHGKIVGGAEIRSDLTLKKAKPVLLPRGHSKTSYPFADSNIKAWVDKREGPQLLIDAYKDLIFRSGSWWRRYDSQKSWTIEPVTSESYVHSALVASGLIKIITGQFDDGRKMNSYPTKSVLYAMIYNDRLSDRGKLAELKKGTKGWSDT